MSIDVQGYIGTTIAPWGKLFYRLVWNHLHCEGKRILDFGSGLGITANYLAKKNEVIAIEPNSEYALQRNDWKYEEDWIENMFRMECAVEELSEFREIAFFHHVILKPR